VTQRATVWLTDWQVGDTGLAAAPGIEVEWRLSAPDVWTARLFGDPRSIDFELDTEVDAVPGRAVIVTRGLVEDVECVRVTRSPDGAAVDGSATTERVRSTLEMLEGDVMGYLVRLRVDAMTPDVT
jgi:hypothetical protein